MSLRLSVCKTNRERFWLVWFILKVITPSTATAQEIVCFVGKYIQMNDFHLSLPLLLVVLNTGYELTVCFSLQARPTLNCPSRDKTYDFELSRILCPSGLGSVVTNDVLTGPEWHSQHYCGLMGGRAFCAVWFNRGRRQHTHTHTHIHTHQLEVWWQKCWIFY